jgi:hypothetical protein
MFGMVGDKQRSGAFIREEFLGDTENMLMK